MNTKTPTPHFSLVLYLLPLGRGERLQLQAGLVDVQNSQAEKGVPHLIQATRARTRAHVRLEAVRNGG